MSGFLFLVTGLIAVFGAGSGRADVREIRALEAEQKQLVLERDALAGEHAVLMFQADSLSALIDSFKLDEENSAELQEALRASLVLERRLVETDHQLEILEVKRESQRERLRLAYDWEVGVLIQRVAQQPDEGLLQQLVIYQEAREALGEKVGAMGLRYGGNMAISPDDSPDEISQKAELMEDIARRLEAEALETNQRLSRLENEHRLRSRVRIFTTEIRLFDEHLPEGRVLSRLELAKDNAALGQEMAEVAPANADALGLEGLVEVKGAETDLERKSDALFESHGDSDFSPSKTTREVLVARRELVRIENATHEDLGGNDIKLEIRRLKAHQQEIRHLQAIARERAEAFRKHLLQLLEGNE